MNEFVPALEVLHTAMRDDGAIDEATIRALSQRIGVSPTELWGAATAYPLFGSAGDRARLSEVSELPASRPATIGVPDSAFFGSDDPREALLHARKLAPDDIIANVRESGLQGRGGAG